MTKEEKAKSAKNPQVANDSEVSLVDALEKGMKLDTSVGESREDDLKIKREKLISEINALTTKITSFLKSW